MNMIFNFSIEITPPSVNNYWRATCKSGRQIVYLSKSGLEFKNTMQKAMRCVYKDKPTKSPVSVYIWYHYKGRGKDIDNILKPILDSMNKLIFEDDSQIVSLTIKKKKSDKNLIEISVIEEENEM